MQLSSLEVSLKINIRETEIQKCIKIAKDVFQNLNRDKKTLLGKKRVNCMWYQSFYVAVNAGEIPHGKKKKKILSWLVKI